MHTFSAGYGTDDRELVNAEQVARVLGTQHHPLLLSPQDLPGLLPWMVWELNEGWTTFINIGIWREGADFQQQIGRFIDNSRPPLAFEADRRRRVFMAPERWRIGNTPLLKEDHLAVR